MDPSLLVAVASVATAAVTTAGGVAVAVLTNRQEAENSAEGVLDQVQQERLTLKDEQIAALEKQKQNRDDQIARLKAENEQLKLDLAQARGGVT